jgi:nucleoside-diphosphate-sugar epimerase
MNKKLRVNISGSTGFVGNHMTAYLAARAYEMVAIPLRNPDEQTWLKGGGAVIHLAGMAHDVKNVHNAEHYDLVNFELSRKLFDHFVANADCNLFIFVSSIKALRDHSTDWLTEDMAPTPTSAYGISKRKAEQYILDHVPKDKCVIILRPCMIHGPGNKGNLNLLFQFVQKGLPWPLGAFENQRSFLSIENLCYVIDAILNKPIPSGIYHIADDEPVSTNQIIQLIGKSLNKKVRIWKLPKPIVKGIASLNTILRLPMNTERLEKLTENYLVSNQKLVLALGSDLPINSIDGLTTTFASFKQHDE